MKNKYIIGLMGLLISASIHAQNTTDRSTITVTGTAKTEVIPDIMNWKLEVENKGKNLETVANTHAKTVEKLLEILTKFKVKSDKTKTSNMSFGEDWGYILRNRVKLGYKASTSVSFSLNDFKQYKALWLELSTIETISVASVLYDYSKRTEVENEVRQTALLAAISKAKGLVTVLNNTELGNPLSIKEGYRPNHGKGYDDMDDDGFGFGDEATTPIAAGLIEIKMNISVIFRLLAPTK